MRKQKKIEIIRTSKSLRTTIGDLYVDGVWCCHTLELPYRWNINDFSSIPVGEYGAIIRYYKADRGNILDNALRKIRSLYEEQSVKLLSTDPLAHWRIELTGTGSRENTQIHKGTKPDQTYNNFNTNGCILIGNKVNPKENSISDDAGAHQRLMKMFYGPENMNARGEPIASPNVEIRIHIKDGNKKEEMGLKKSFKEVLDSKISQCLVKDNISKIEQLKKSK